MDVCFVIPKMKWQFDHFSDPPLGLLSVASSARNQEICGIPTKVSLYDMGDTNSSLPDAEVYAFSASTLEFPTIVEVANHISKEKPLATMIAGGPHFDVFSEQYWKEEISQTPFDIISRGEGESNIEEILYSVAFDSRKKKVISQKKVSP